jgi:hypothetical protein
VINSLLIDLPEALVFIALALLALECVEFADIYIDPNSSVLPLQLDETVD